MDDKTAKEMMINSMVYDLGINSTYQEVPEWINEICDLLIRKGWRKEDYT